MDMTRGAYLRLKHLNHTKKAPNWAVKRTPTQAMPSAFSWPVLVPSAPAVLRRRLPWALGPHLKPCVSPSFEGSACARLALIARLHARHQQVGCLSLKAVSKPPRHAQQPLASA